MTPHLARSQAVVRLVFTAALIVVMALYCVRALRVGGDLTTFLGGSGPLVEISRRLADSELTRTIVVAVRAEGKDTQDSGPKAAKALMAALRSDPELDWLRSAPKGDPSQAVYDLYHRSRLLMFSASPERDLPAASTAEGLKLRAQASLRELSGPRGDFVKRMLPNDPLGAFEQRVAALTRMRTGELQLDGDLVRDRLGWSYLFMSTRSSAFDIDAQAGLHARIEAAVARIEADQGVELELERSAVGRMAMAAKRDIRADLERITWISLVGVLGTMVLVFRSLWYCLLASLPLGFGVLCALSLTSVVFGQISGLTLAFGATLIGIAIDYPLHLMNHSACVGTGTGRRHPGSLQRALILGALTTLVGFGGLALASAAGLREMALFTGTGIFAALAFTLWVLPLLLPAPLRATPTQAALMAVAGRARLWMAEHRRVLWLLPAIGLLLTFVGLPQIRAADGVDVLQARDPELVAEEEAVRARISRMDAGRLLIARGETLESALVANDALAHKLVEAERSGWLEAHQTLHSLLWSAQLQERNRLAWQAARDGGLSARLDAAFAAVGFRPGAFAEFAETLDNELDEAPIVRLADLQGTPLAELADRHVIRDGQGWAILTMVRGVSERGALREFAQSVPGVVWYDRSELSTELFAQHRREAGRMLGWGLFAVWLILLLRYRKLSLSLAGFAPALLGAGATAGILGLCQIEFNLMHWVALLLVASVGADYGVFLVESTTEAAGGSDVQTTGQHVDATTVSVTLACVSTLFSLGALAFAEHPALHAIGSTTGLGVFMCWLMAPLALTLVTNTGDAPTGSK